MAVTNHYCTAEHYYEYEHEVRVQKIGNHYRAYKKIPVAHEWKSNVGSCIVEDVPMTAQFKLWIDEASKIFGGLDICAVCLIHWFIN